MKVYIVHCAASYTRWEAGIRDYIIIAAKDRHNVKDRLRRILRLHVYTNNPNWVADWSNLREL